MKKLLTLFVTALVVLAIGKLAVSQIAITQKASAKEPEKGAKVASAAPKTSMQEGSPLISTISISIENLEPALEAKVESEVYFVLANFEGDDSQYQLVHLPGSCIVAERDCPSPNVVETPFDPQYMGQLDWSPDGRQAVTVVSQQEETEWGIRQIPPSALYLYDAEEETWSNLFESSEQVIIGARSHHLNTRWSANGEWIAFTMVETSGSKNVDTLNIIRPDGSNREMIFSPASPQFAWAGEKLLLRSIESPDELTNPKIVIRSIDPESKEVQVLFAAGRPESMVVSPGGRMIAIADQHDPRNPTPIKEIRLLDLSGNLVQTLGVYPNQLTGIFPVTWSSDGSLIAYHNLGNMIIAEIKPDPTPTSVYQADHLNVQPRITSAVFSPQNRYLLMEVWDGNDKLVAVSIDGQEQNVVTWPGQSALDEVYLTSWRPPADL